ncbi:hypothetical protein F090043F1_20690 [Parabacteroides goldsteinii]
MSQITLFYRYYDTKQELSVTHISSNILLPENKNTHLLTQPLSIIEITLRYTQKIFRLKRI